MLDENVYPAVNQNWQFIKIFLSSHLITVIPRARIILRDILRDSDPSVDVVLLQHDHRHPAGPQVTDQEVDIPENRQSERGICQWQSETNCLHAQ